MLERLDVIAGVVVAVVGSLAAVMVAWFKTRRPSLSRREAQQIARDYCPYLQDRHLLLERTAQLVDICQDIQGQVQELAVQREGDKVRVQELAGRVDRLDRLEVLDRRNGR